MSKIITYKSWFGCEPGATKAALVDALNDDTTDGIKLDIRMTKDGEIVVISDAALERCTRGHGVVENMSLEELREYAFAVCEQNEYVPQRIMTLGEVLQLVNAHNDIVIEIKKLGANGEGKLYTLLLEHCNPDKIYVESFNHEYIKSFKELVGSSIQTGLMMVGLPTLIVDQVRYTQSDFVSFNYESVDALLVETLHVADIDLMVWAVETAEAFAGLQGLSDNLTIVSSKPQLAGTL